MCVEFGCILLRLDPWTIGAVLHIGRCYAQSAESRLAQRERERESQHSLLSHLLGQGESRGLLLRISRLSHPTSYLLASVILRVREYIDLRDLRRV